VLLFATYRLTFRSFSYTLRLCSLGLVYQADANSWLQRLTSISSVSLIILT
jgi:hypothetical protein